MLRRFSGATVRRTIDRSHARVPEHAHDWPLLSFFVIGSYSNRTELGEKYVAGPSAVFYRAGAVHQNTVGSTGFEQIEIEFDPDWLGRSLLPRVPVAHWCGGRTGAETRTMARLCGSEIAEHQFQKALRQFVNGAVCRSERESPNWVGVIARRLGAEAFPKIADLAREVRRHPSWLGSAYARACGERLQETVGRIRVERAARQLRETDEPLAYVALEAGFCDQSHMNRTFRRILGRLPSEVRKDRQRMRQLSP
jgi:AraC family transcriptional regulator